MKNEGSAVSNCRSLALLGMTYALTVAGDVSFTMIGPPD
jgi:hypothetical protein